jgi:hypothetical protein
VTTEELAQLDAVTSPALLPAPEPQSFDVPLATLEEPRGISQPQRRKLFAIAGHARIPDTSWRSYMLSTFGTDSTRALTQTQYEALCDDLENGDVAQWLEERASIQALESEAA